MKINGVLKTPDFYNNKKESTTKKSKISQYSTDQFTLSKEARDFQSIYKAMNQTPDIREEKVSKIKAQIESGTYSVSSQEIANKILSNNPTI